MIREDLAHCCSNRFAGDSGADRLIFFQVKDKDWHFIIHAERESC